MNKLGAPESWPPYRQQRGVSHLDTRSLDLKRYLGSSCAIRIWNLWIRSDSRVKWFQWVRNICRGQRPRDVSELGLLRAYLRPDREMTERPEGFLDRNQRWLPCCNRKSFSSLTFSGHMLCCTFIGVWSNTVHTQAALISKVKRILWPETRRTCLKLFAWRVPNFSLLFLPCWEACLCFSRSTHDCLFSRSFQA